MPSTPVRDGLGSDTSGSSERRGGSVLIRRCGEAHVHCVRGRNHTAGSVSRGGAGVNGISHAPQFSQHSHRSAGAGKISAA
jgi:hypothetical protein